MAYMQCVQFFVRLMNKGVTLISLPLSLLVMKHCQKVPHPDGRAYLFRKKILKRVMKAPE